MKLVLVIEFEIFIRLSIKILTVFRILYINKSGVSIKEFLSKTIFYKRKIVSTPTDWPVWGLVLVRIVRRAEGSSRGKQDKDSSLSLGISVLGIEKFVNKLSLPWSV